MSGRGRGNRSGYHGGRGGRSKQGGSSTGRSDKSKNDNGNGTSTNKQKLFQPHQVGNQHVDTHDSVLEEHLTNVQKGLVDGGLIVKATRDGKWDSAVPVKPTMTKIDFRKCNVTGELMLTTGGDEQCETVEIKLPVISYRKQ